MAYQTIYNAEMGIIETMLEGIISLEEVREVIQESTRLAKETGCTLWLTDYSRAAPHLTTTEIFELPKLFAQAAVELGVSVNQIKRVIVISKDNADYPFAQIISRNRGQSLELFDDLQQARDWLMKKAG